MNLNIRAASQIALLGAVTSNLRAVNIIQNDKMILVNFYYQTIEIGEEEIPEVFSTEMFAYFEDYEISANAIILPLPQPIPEEGIRIFYRRE